MEEVDAEISEMKLFLNGRARFVAEGYLAQVIRRQLFILTASSPSLFYF
jgi:actin related protein 2/3 complex subunit 4